MAILVLFLYSQQQNSQTRIQKNMVFQKGEAKGAKGAKGKVAPDADTIPPPEKKDGPTVQHKAYQGDHWNHEDKQHIKFLRNKIKDGKAITEEDAEWAKAHHVDISQATIRKGPSSPRSPKGKGKKKVDYDHMVF